MIVLEHFSINIQKLGNLEILNFMILREDSIDDSVKKSCTNKELKVLMHITPIADKYEAKESQK